MPTPPSTNNYAIGKGVMSIALWSGGAPGAYEDIGNCPTVEVEPTIERLDHFSSRQSLRLKDKSIVLEANYSLTFECDEIAAANLNRFLMGTISGTNLIQGLQGTENEYALRFTSNNPVGPNAIWDFWRATLSPNGPMALIGEEWMLMSFLAEGLADLSNHPTSPYMSVNVVVATSTTTTTTTT